MANRNNTLDIESAKNPFCMNISIKNEKGTSLCKKFKNNGNSLVTLKLAAILNFFEPIKFSCGRFSKNTIKMCTRATCAALKALEALDFIYNNPVTEIKFIFPFCLQKSRSNGGRRNHGETGGWFQQAVWIRLQVAAEEVPYQGGVRRSKEQEDLLRLNTPGLRPVRSVPTKFS